jgi:hypothetical protein
MRSSVPTYFPDYRSSISTGLRSLGYGLGGAVSTVLGFGDYKVRQNSLVHPTRSDQAPSFSTSNGSVRLRHREYLRDVYGSTGFAITSFNINPADSNTFPWLSKIAEHFEQWQPHGLIFDYRSMSSDVQVAATTALGSVILGTEYNALASRFVNKQAMEASQFAVSVKPSVSVMHPIECDLSQTPSQPLYVRLPGDATINADPRLYDLGNFQIATQGMSTDGGDQGELWVTYDIELLKPVLTQPAPIPPPIADSRASHFYTTVLRPDLVLAGSQYDMFAVPPLPLFDNIGVAFPAGGSGGVFMSLPAGLDRPCQLTLHIASVSAQTFIAYPPQSVHDYTSILFGSLSNITELFILRAGLENDAFSPTSQPSAYVTSSTVTIVYMFRLTNPLLPGNLTMKFGVDAVGYPTIPYTGNPNAGATTSVDLMISEFPLGFL